MMAVSFNSDWIETIVVVAIVAMSALGSVAKFFIRKFSPQDKPDGTPRGVPGRPMTQRGTPDPQRPVARPLPPPLSRPVVPGHTVMERPAPTRREPIPVPEPLRDILAEVVPELVPPRRQARPGSSSSPEPPTVEHREAHKVSSRRRVASSRSPARRTGRSRSAGSTKHDRPSSQPQRATTTEQRIGHLESNLDSVARASTGDSASIDYLSAIKHPSRHALRTAILMNEILGTPVSLRDPDHSLH